MKTKHFYWQTLTSNTYLNCIITKNGTISVCIWLMNYPWNQNTQSNITTTLKPLGAIQVNTHKITQSNIIRA